jgi:hypothetical protein
VKSNTKVDWVGVNGGIVAFAEAGGYAVGGTQLTSLCAVFEAKLEKPQ